MRVFASLVTGSLVALTLAAVAGEDGHNAGPAVLEGRVVAPSGEPVPGARILAAGSAGSGAWAEPARGETGEDGRFSLEVPGEPRFELYVRAEGYADEQLSADEDEGALEVELEPARVARGVVHERDTGEPIAGARVRPLRKPLGGEVSPEEARRLLPAARTDETGRFALGRMSAGVQQVIVEAEGYAVASLEVETVPFEAEAPATAAEPVRVYLVPGVPVDGRVVDGAGEPVVGARVSVRPDRMMANVTEAFQWRSRGLYSARTLADGSFSFPGVPRLEAYTLTASAEGFAHGRWVDLRPGAGGGLSGLELTMTRGGSVRARLVDADGDPLTGRVTLKAHYPDPEADADRRPHRVFEGGEVDAESGGELIVEHLPPGEPSIRLQPDGFEEIVVDAVTISEGRTADLGELIVEEGLSIAGRVVDSEGEPVADAQVRARGFSGFGLDTRSSRTREDGRFRIGGLKEGVSYDLQVEASDLAPAQRQEVEPGTDGVEVTLGAGGTLQGTVVSMAGGTPVPKYTIALVPASAEAGGLDPQSLMRQLLSERETVTRADGNFAMTGLAPGEYRLRIRAPGFVPQVVDGVKLSTGEPTEVGPIELDPGTTISGTVTDAETGQPVVGASVSLAGSGPLAMARRQMDGDGALALTAPDGSFRAGGLAAGSHTLVVEHPDYANAEHELEIDPATPQPAVEIAMTRGGAVEGVVLGEDGRPVVGAQVMAMAGFTPNPSKRTTTDERGHYRLEHLQPGAIRVMVMNLDMSQGQPDMGSVMSSMKMETVEVRDGETAMLSFPSPDGGIRVSGRVLLSEDEPFEAILTWLPDEGGGFRGGSYASAVSRADGSFSVQLPRPGRYRVLARPRDDDNRRGEVYTLSATVEEGPEARVDLRVPETSVSGMVGDAETGERLEGVRVVARPKEAERRFGGAVTTDDQGRYELRGLEPGDYDLVFTSGGYAIDLIEDVEIEQGDEREDQDLSLMPATEVSIEVIDGAGRPVEGALAMTLGDAGIGGVQLGLTDADGRLAIDRLPSGEHDVALWARGHAPKVAQVMVPPESGSVPLVEIGPGSSLEVSVTGAAGEPLEDVAVEVSTGRGVDLTDLLSVVTSMGEGGLQTGADGTVKLPPLEPGEYRVTARLGELRSTEKVEVHADEPNALEMELR